MPKLKERSLEEQSLQVVASTIAWRTLMPLAGFKLVHGDAMYRRIKNEHARKYNGMIVKNSKNAIYINIPIFEEWLMDNNLKEVK